MLQRLQAMVVAFLDVVQAAHLSFVDGQQLDALAAPSVRGVRRTAGVDLQKPRMRAVAEAVIALAGSLDQTLNEAILEPGTGRLATDEAAAIVGAAMQFSPFHSDINFAAALIAGHSFELKPQGLFQNLRHEMPRCTGSDRRSAAVRERAEYLQGFYRGCRRACRVVLSRRSGDPMKVNFAKSNFTVA
jgi:hypothetical protein